jgi:hypothetical protein
MVHQQDGESFERSSLNETTTPVTTVELLQLIRATISHPSTKAAPMNSVISLLLVQLATIVKAQRPSKNTIVNVQEEKKNAK